MCETTIDDRAVDGDRVWTRATSKGINRETGERSLVTWLIVQRIDGGRIAEHWVATFTGVDWTDLTPASRRSELDELDASIGRQASSTPTAGGGAGPA